MDALDTPVALSPVLDVADQIEGAIRDGRLALGQRLVEADWAKRLGVARTTVREAFQRLEVEGLLCSERHRGYMVRSLTRAEVRSICEVRQALDSLASRLAAPAFHADSAELDWVMERLETARARADLTSFSELNREFHGLIRRRSGNTVITRMLNSLQKSVYHYQYRLLVQGNAVFDSQEDHREIYRALRAGDGDAAALAMSRHVERSLDAYMALPDSAFDRD